MQKLIHIKVRLSFRECVHLGLFFIHLPIARKDHDKTYIQTPIQQSIFQQRNRNITEQQHNEPATCD